MESSQFLGLLCKDAVRKGTDHREVIVETGSNSFGGNKRNRIYVAFVFPRDVAA
jgi:hypothetical protein